MSKINKNTKTMRDTFLGKQLVKVGVLVVLFVATIASTFAQMQARENYGALLELKDRVYTGAGQAGVTGFDGFESYFATAPSGQKPVIFMDYYDSYNMRPNWSLELKQEILKYHRQGYYIIPQIGYNIDYFWEDIIAGKHEKELNNLVKGFQYLGIPCFLRIGYEFNNQKNWSPDQYKKAFQVVAKKIKDANLEVATVFCAGLSGNAGAMSYYPGDEYVDWMSFDVFSDIVDGNHSTMLEIINGAKEHKKPVLVGEASPMRVNQVTYNDWSWYDIYFNKILEVRNTIKQTTYINWDWDIQDMAGGNGMFPWGDARLHMPGSVKNQFFAELSDPAYFHASSEKATRSLFFYNDSQAPNKVGGLSRSGDKLTWSPASDNGGAGLAHYTIYKDGKMWDYIIGTEYPIADLGYGSTSQIQVMAVDRAGNASPLSSSLTVNLNSSYELIQDGEFDLPSTSLVVDWKFMGTQDGNAKPAPDDITGNFDHSGLLSGQNCVKLTWDKDLADPKDWKIQFFQAFQVQKGEKYTISFMAKSDEPTKVRLYFMDNHPNWNCTHFPAGTDPNFDTEWEFYQIWDVELGPKAKTYTYESTAPVSETARLSFMFGKSHRTAVYLDAISVKAGGGSQVFAKAGADQSVKDTDGDGFAEVMLDGTGSYSNSGTITSYVWAEGSKQLSTSAKATVKLAVGDHTISLTVKDDKGNTATDYVGIQVVGKPEAPSNLVADVLSMNKIKLGWQDNSSFEDGYKVYRDGKEIASLGANTTKYEDSGLKASTEYCYEVKAYNTVGSSNSNKVCATTLDPSSPVAPSGLNAKATSSTSVGLTWKDNSDNEQGFKVYRDGKLVATLASNAASYSDTELSPETEYSYVISSYNEVGEAKSEAVTVKTIAEGQCSVTHEHYNYSVSQEDGSFALLYTFESKVSSSYVDLYISVDGNNYQGIRGTKNGDTWTWRMTAHPSTQPKFQSGSVVSYYFMYQHNFNPGQSKTDVATFVIDSGCNGANTRVASVDNNVDVEKYVIYPSPANNTVVVDGLGNNAPYIIYSSTGSKVKVNAGNVIDVSTLNKGVYMIVSEGKQVGRFVKE